MKRATILVQGGLDERFRSILLRYQKFVPKAFEKYLKLEGRLQLPLLDGSAELEQCLDELDSLGLTVMKFSCTEYTKKELEQAPFFQLQPLWAPLELEGTSSIDYGTPCVNGCDRCGYNEGTIGDVLVDRKFIKKSGIGYLPPDYIVSEDVKQLIEEAGFTGVQFSRKVKDYKGRDMSPYYIIDIDSILPPLAGSTWLIPQRSPSCKSCGHSVTYLYSDLYYHCRDIENAKDFNISTERLNNWILPEIVVSKEVRSFFQKNKIRARYTPIVILD